jgi:short-subunit dehydrogenase
MSKTAVITGATSGIGAAYARRLAADGYDLIITGRRQEIIRKLADDLTTKHNIKVKVIIAELSDENDVRKVIKAIENAENVEILINNAGYGGLFRPILHVTPADYDRMIKVHQLTPLQLILAVVPRMIERRKGTIINVSSLSAYAPTPAAGIYQGSKSFLKLFSESLHMELKDKGIRVQALCPGYVDTDFFRDSKSEEEKTSILSGFRTRLTMSPDSVVDYSLKCLKKDRVICIPGAIYRLLWRLVSVIPGNLYYKWTSRLIRVE